MGERVGPPWGDFGWSFDGLRGNERPTGRARGVRAARLARQARAWPNRPTTGHSQHTIFCLMAIIRSASRSLSIPISAMTGRWGLPKPLVRRRHHGAAT